mmetsp:Transcript_49841/g.58175  ORF Transcript_49841/g.58175 Transcript_49841/m.58175 type:complete len:82 (-) Transcript_49841:737-982(-)
MAKASDFPQKIMTIAVDCAGIGYVHSSADSNETANNGINVPPNSIKLALIQSVSFDLNCVDQKTKDIPVIMDNPFKNSRYV